MNLKVAGQTNRWKQAHDALERAKTISDAKIKDLSTGQGNREVDLATIQQLQQQLNQALQDLRTHRDNSQKCTAEVVRLQNENRQLQNENATLRQRQVSTQQVVMETAAGAYERKRLETTVDDLQRRLQTAETNLRAEETKNLANIAQLNRLTQDCANLQQINQDLKQCQDDLRAEEKEHDELIDERDKAMGERDALRRQLDSTVAGHNQTRLRDETSIANLRDQLNAKDRTIASLEANFEQSTAQHAQAQANNMTLTDQNEALRDMILPRQNKEFAKRRHNEMPILKLSTHRLNKSTRWKPH